VVKWIGIAASESILFLKHVGGVPDIMVVSNYLDRHHGLPNQNLVSRASPDDLSSARAFDSRRIYIVIQGTLGAVCAGEVGWSELTLAVGVPAAEQLSYDCSSYFVDASAFSNSGFGG